MPKVSLGGHRIGTGSHSSRRTVAGTLKQSTRTAGPKPACPERRAVPIRSCSGWGLPCRFRCRSRGALLPHPFTLTSSKRGGLLSVALSLDRQLSPPARRALPATLVSWSPDFPRDLAITRLPGPLASGHLACPRSRSNSSSNSNAPICPSTSPSIRCGRQRRWNARTAAFCSEMSYPKRSSAR